MYGCLAWAATATSAPAARNHRHAVAPLSRATTAASTAPVAGARPHSSKLAAWASAGRNQAVPSTASTPPASAALRLPESRRTSRATSTPLTSTARAHRRRTMRMSTLRLRASS